MFVIGAELKKILQTADIKLPGYDESILRFLDDVALGLTLIVQLAHDLFDEVFDRHHSRYVAVFINDDGHVALLLLQFAQQFRCRLCLRHEISWPQDAVHRLSIGIHV